MPIVRKKVEVVEAPPEEKKESPSVIVKAIDPDLVPALRSLEAALLGAQHKIIRVKVSRKNGLMDELEMRVSPIKER
jgi:hypothetical protein